MKKFILFLFCLIPFLSEAQENQSQLNLTLHNIGTGYWYYGSPIGFYITNAVFYCDGTFMHGSYSTLGTTIGSIAPSNAPTYNVTFSGLAADGYGCSGSSAQYAIYAMSNSVILQPALATWQNNYYSSASQATETLNLIVDGVAFAVTNLPVYTNYTFYIGNTLGVNGVATWTYNGSVAKTEILGPFHSDTWTTPQIEVSPVAELYTISLSLVPVGNSIGYNADGSPNFAAGSTGGGITGGASGSGGSITPTAPSGSGTTDGGGQTVTTNGIALSSGTNSEITIGTNLISWAPPSGTASESTVEAAATLAHSDALNLLQGLSVINSSINNNFQTTTNELGQLVGIGTSNNILGYNADADLNQIATNTARMATNQSLLTISNLTLTVSNQPLTLTNYATESTLESISNILASGDTNMGSLFDTNEPITNFDSAIIGPTNYDDASSQSLGASSDYSDAESSFGTFVDSMTAPSVDEDFGGAGNMTYTFDLGSSGTQIIDFNPLDDSAIAELFAFAKTLWTWGLAIYYLRECSRDSMRMVHFLSTLHGGNAQGIASKPNVPAAQA